MSNTTETVFGAPEDEFKGVRATMKDEWNSRTWYGKLWFPLWAFIRLMAMFIIAFTIFVLCPGVFKPAIARATAPVRKRVALCIRWVRGLTPEVHSE